MRQAEARFSDTFFGTIINTYTAFERLHCPIPKEQPTRMPSIRRFSRPFACATRKKPKSLLTSTSSEQSATSITTIWLKTDRVKQLPPCDFLNRRAVCYLCNYSVLLWISSHSVMAERSSSSADSRSLPSSFSRREFVQISGEAINSSISVMRDSKRSTVCSS